MTFKRKASTTKKLAIGSAIAGVAGYLAGVLTAPKSGQQTRDDIGNKAVGVKDSAENQLQDLNEELKELIKSTKDKAATLSSSAKAEFNETLIRAKDAQNKSAQVLKAVKNGEAADPDLSKAVKQARLAIKNLGKFLKG